MQMTKANNQPIVELTGAVMVLAFESLHGQMQKMQHLISINENCNCLLIAMQVTKLKNKANNKPSVESARAHTVLAFEGLQPLAKCKKMQHLIFIYESCNFSLLHTVTKQKNSQQPTNYGVGQGTCGAGIWGLAVAKCKNASSHFYSWDLKSFTHCYTSGKTKNEEQPTNHGVQGHSWYWHLQACIGQMQIM